MDCIRTYRIVPLIFPRRNFKLWKVVRGIQLALDFFNDKKDWVKKKITLLRQLLQEFEQKITHWEDFMPKRSLIEDIFKVMKKTFSLDHLHKFTYASVAKHTALGVLLVGVAIHLGFVEMEQLQSLAEW